MILRRLGNKSKIAQDIQRHFPPHTLYIEPFFGAGGMFFNKPKAKYNILNDSDEDVYNLYKVLLSNRMELETAIEKFIVHESLWNHYKKSVPECNVERALRFLFLSNFGYMGKPNSLSFVQNLNAKNVLLENIDPTFNMLQDCVFSCRDFRAMINQIKFDVVQANNMLIYYDPPYLDTQKYNKDFTESDSISLFDFIEKLPANQVMSEFSPFILQQAKERGLYVHEIGERQNMKNRRTEILITNYRPNLHQQQSMF